MENPFMKEAIKEAQLACLAGEVPVGAVIVRDGEILARGHNLCENQKNPLAHAELLVLKEAHRVLNRTHLFDCDLYVTLEPCAMCSGAIAHSGIKRVYFGAYDAKGGFAVSNDALLLRGKLMHKPECYCGMMEEECSALLQDFFKTLRQTCEKDKL